MARGWESKDVESQLENARSVVGKSDKGSRDPEQKKRDGERQQLELSRTRILNDLQTASNPNHRKSLEAALAHLDQKISNLK
jgi:hypothetical protein